MSKIEPHKKRMPNSQFKNKICTINKLKIKSCYITHDAKNLVVKFEMYKVKGIC
jgi:hypothetical protein